jgi:hypothetical protein
MDILKTDRIPELPAKRIPIAVVHPAHTSQKAESSLNHKLYAK